MKLKFLPETISSLSEIVTGFLSNKSDKSIPHSLKEDMRHFQRLLMYYQDEDLQALRPLIEEVLQDLYNLLLIQLNKFDLTQPFVKENENSKTNSDKFQEKSVVQGINGDHSMDNTDNKKDFGIDTSFNSETTTQEIYKEYMRIDQK